MLFHCLEHVEEMSGICSFKRLLLHRMRSHVTRFLGAKSDPSLKCEVGSLRVGMPFGLLTIDRRTNFRIHDMNAIITYCRVPVPFPTGL
jgi:hypothetical protein